MIFKALNVLINKQLDKNEMVEGELYIFKVKGKNILAWLEGDQLKIKAADRNE